MKFQLYGRSLSSVTDKLNRRRKKTHTLDLFKLFDAMQIETTVSGMIIVLSFQ